MALQDLCDLKKSTPLDVLIPFSHMYSTHDGLFLATTYFSCSSQSPILVPPLPWDGRPVYSGLTKCGALLKAGVQPVSCTEFVLDPQNQHFRARIIRHWIKSLLLIRPLDK